MCTYNAYPTYEVVLLNSRTFKNLPTVFQRKWESVMYHLSLRSRLQLDWTASRRTQKVNSPVNQKGYDKSETTIRKLSARKIQICCAYFCVIHCDLFFQNSFPNNIRTKIGTVGLDSPRQILLFRGLRSFWGASVR